MPYEYLIFDLDGTLLDYHQAQEHALEKVLASCDLSSDDYTKSYLKDLSTKEWNKTGLQNRLNNDIQNNYHDLFRQYLTNFFQKFEELFSVDKTSEELVKGYLKALSEEIHPLPDAIEVCQELSNYFFLFLVTNGLLEVQLPRMESLRPYFRKLFISEHVGHIKPSKEFFDIVLQDPEIEPSKCLLIGDSLSSDIFGGGSVGMDTCWYNPTKRNNFTAIHPNYEIHSLKQLLELKSGNLK